LAESSPFQSIGESLNRGEPVPVTDVHLFAKYFYAAEKVRERRPQISRENIAVGVGALGTEFELLDPALLVSLGFRYRLLSSLMSSGELDAYVADQASRERVRRIWEFSTA
jgi:hypothetical protein